LPDENTAKVREAAWLTLLLVWVGGCVDAIGYLALAHLFTAHMSGNSAAMGAHLGQGDWRTALHRAFPIPLFVLGIALGAALVELAARQGVRAPFALVLALEGVLLAGFMACGSRVSQGGAIRVSAAWEFYALAALPTLAMGIQNATLRRVGRRHVRTTYISGMLTHLGEEIAAYCFWLLDRACGRKKGGTAEIMQAASPLGEVMLYAGIWGAFALGAILGGYAETRWALASLTLPLCGLAVVIACDLISPVEMVARPRSEAAE